MHTADIISYFFTITIELSILFIGISLLVGLVMQYITPDGMSHAFSKTRLGSGNVLSALAGALTPFCSCSTIPLLLGMLEAGVPFGVGMSFLIASPLLNPIIMTLFVSLLGIRVAVLYFVSVFLLAIGIGIVLEKAGYSIYLKDVTLGKATESMAVVGHGQRLRHAVSFAKTLYLQLMPYMIVGAAVGAAIYGIVPQDTIAAVAGPGNVFAVPLAALIGIPLYVRASTLIPIGAALVDKGMAIGAVMALIIGGAGASIPELTMLSAMFERRLVLAYMASILLVAVLTGTAINLLTG